MNRRRLVRGFLAAWAMLVIILDAKTAVVAAQEGIQLCIRTVIPSLFPFFVLSGIINACLFGQRISLLRPLGRLCRLPTGCESLFLLGFISGYPVGAQMVTQSWREGKLSLSTAKRMLGFCNNAGPAFVFGMLSPLFENSGTVWLLWGVHILSGLITGWVLPGNDPGSCEVAPGTPVTLMESMRNAIKAMVSVCGWVVAFHVILGFCNRWFFWLLPTHIQVLLSGVLELSNGCVLLQRLPQAGMRFIVAAVLLSFGGVCVGMQTLSVTEGLGSGWYFPGKVLQATLSLALSCAIQMVIFNAEDRIMVSVIGMCMVITLVAFSIYFMRCKKVVAFRRIMLYNTTD